VLRSRHSDGYAAAQKPQSGKFDTSGIDQKVDLQDGNIQMREHVCSCNGTRCPCSLIELLDVQISR